MLARISRRSDDSRERSRPTYLDDWREGQLKRVSKFRQNLESATVVYGSTILVDALDEIEVPSEFPSSFDKRLSEHVFDFVEKHSQQLSLPLNVSIGHDAPIEHVVSTSKVVVLSQDIFRGLLQTLILELKAEAKR